MAYNPNAIMREETKEKYLKVIVKLIKKSVKWMFFLATNISDISFFNDCKNNK